MRTATHPPTEPTLTPEAAHDPRVVEIGVGGRLAMLRPRFTFATPIRALWLTVAITGLAALVDDIGPLT